LADKVFIDHIEVTVTALASEEAHAHGLDGIPDLVVLTHGTHADITIGATAPTATNIYLDNANAGNQDALVLVLKLHSLISVAA